MSRPLAGTGAITGPPKFRLTRTCWIGIGLFVVGSGPLLLIILFAALGWTSDPNPNPVGPGILAMLTFWPSIVLILIGLVRSVLLYRRAKSVTPGSEGE